VLHGSALERKLEEWSLDIELALSREQIEKMVRLDDLVVDWGPAVRLTGFSEEKERLERYFGEALHVVPAFPVRATAVDIGSGGGTPALPLAIARPAIQWILLEPNKKKAVFLEEAKTRLGLSNVEVRRERYEAFERDRPIDLVTTRGLSVDDELLACVWRWLESDGCLYLWTGRSPAEEIGERCGGGWAVKSSVSLPPRCESCLLILKRLEAPSK
jgi:16S rRNA (guanine527-N7)-methyltransferase